MLTVKALENLKPGPAAKEYADGLVSGLYYALQPGGSGSWTVRYRHHGKSRKVTLGPYPAIGLGDARKAAKAILGQVAQGRDPAGEKKAARRQASAHDLVETVLENFITLHVRNLKSADEVKRTLRKEILPAFKGRRIGVLSRADIHAPIDGLAERGAPSMAWHAFTYFRTMCAWAVDRGLIEVSPCAGIKAPPAGKSRDRVLADGELANTWRAAETLGWPYGPIIQLQIETLQRLGEVAGMRWAELDLERALWRLPKERTKNGVAHDVPLSLQVMAIIEALPRIVNDADLVFVGRGGKPVANFARAKARIDALLPKDMKHWVLHDLRRTGASGMAGIEIAPHVIEACLNHKSGTVRGVAAVYNRYDYAREKRDALDRWASHVETITGSNVVSISSRA